MFEHLRISKLIVIASLAILFFACQKLIPPAPAENAILDGPLLGLNHTESQIFLQGDRAFNDEIFTGKSGLGPRFVSSSCGSCHAGDGKGHPFTSLIRFGQTSPNTKPDQSIGGPQLQNRALPGFAPEALPAGLPYMTIMPPAVTGLGFLAALSDSQIMANADPNDDNGDGISGVASLIIPPDYFVPKAIHDLSSNYVIGRFGKKAAAVDLLHQTVSAYNQDMGITSIYEPYDPVSGELYEAEVTESTINAIVFYLRTLKAPIQREPDNPDVIKGKELFLSLNCSGCHKALWTTGNSDISALSNKTFYPYTDLLLHDMGPELDDGVTEGSAETYEWRTPPLWGLGLSKNSQGGQYFLMHDGRASSIEEAILMHGGEAEQIRNDYKLLSSVEKNQIIQFLESL
jgi:CxxC motif-containing protein (DUF1111 family)